MLIKRQAQALELFPAHRFRAFALLKHGDTVAHRTDEFTQIAAYTLLFLDGVGVIGIAFFEGNRLVGSVFAGNVAQAAVNTFVLIDIGDDVEIEV